MDDRMMAVLARRVLGLAAEREVVEWATSELVENRSSPSLPILAGLSPPLDSIEVDEYLDRVIRERGWQMPPANELIRCYACRVATQICEGASNRSVNLDREAEILFRVAEALDYPADLLAWISLHEDLAEHDAPWALSKGSRRAEIVGSAAELAHSEFCASLKCGHTPAPGQGA